MRNPTGDEVYTRRARKGEGEDVWRRDNIMRDSIQSNAKSPFLSLKGEDDGVRGVGGAKERCSRWRRKSRNVI